jgi:hypothetical protein
MSTGLVGVRNFHGHQNFMRIKNLPFFRSFKLLSERIRVILKNEISLRALHLVSQVIGLFMHVVDHDL